MGIHSVSVAIGLCDRSFRRRSDCVGHALLFQRSVAVIFRSEFQTEEPSCRNDSNLFDGYSYNYAAFGIRDHIHRKSVRNESYPSIRSWRFPYDSDRFLDIVGAGDPSEN